MVEANIHSEGERALDEFKVRVGPSGVVPWERVCADVTKVLEGRLALASRVSERARTHSREHHEMAHQFAPEVRFDNGDTATDTVVEVVGPDSVGLLYRLARALGEFNLDIKGARIHTMGPDVVDSFYVRDANGERITDEDLQQEINRALMEELEQV